MPYNSRSDEKKCESGRILKVPIAYYILMGVPKIGDPTKVIVPKNRPSRFFYNDLAKNVKTRYFSYIVYYGQEKICYFFSPVPKIWFFFTNNSNQGAFRLTWDGTFFWDRPGRTSFWDILYLSVFGFINMTKSS